MEMRNQENVEKRRRKIISKGPVLVRSVKPGQQPAQIYQQEKIASHSLWKN
ncbi:MAG TPA: hypothetical protein VHK91_11875 [Flavisolibacter sp.]|jgi:hypothetical protein|nr:hypothetical protein [Flavisolibacter sp.]